MAYILTSTGNRFYYDNITKEGINIEDVFQSLPRLNRFVGHSSRAYSVGEHTAFCFVMARALGYSIREQLLVFIHDFTEAYVGDCPAPLKRLLPNFEKVESEVEKAICESIGIEPPTEEEHLKVKKVDLTMLVLEMKYLTGHNYEEFINEYTCKEFVNDENFNLSEYEPDEYEVRESLKFIFENLMKEYRDENNG